MERVAISLMCKSDTDLSAADQGSGSCFTRIQEMHPFRSPLSCVKCSVGLLKVCCTRIKATTLLFVGAVELFMLLVLNEILVG